MLIFLPAKFAFLATPKTGTTAVESALTAEAEIVFRGSRKHTPAARFQRKVAPFVKDTYGVKLQAVAVMRNPIDQIASWFRYRSAARLDGSALSTDGLSFEQFVSDVIDDDPPPRAEIGSQFKFFTDGTGTLLVDHLFAYETQPTFRAFLSDRLGKDITLKPRNVSPSVRTSLSRQAESRLREARAAEFALYDQLMAAEGHLHTPQG